MSLSSFWQDLDAEQTFNADSATNVYGCPGRRYRFEWTGNYEKGNVTGTLGLNFPTGNTQQQISMMGL